MRGIKFRAWKHVNTPEMFNNVQAIDFKSGMAHLGYKLSSFTERTDKERLGNLILMQYTGLKDRNGVEIYEGDILEGRSFQYQEDIKGEVYYSKRGTWDCESFILGGLNEDCEVIGNIHEHQHLLGGADK